MLGGPPRSVNGVEPRLRYVAVCAASVDLIVFFNLAGADVTQILFVGHNRYVPRSHHSWPRYTMACAEDFTTMITTMNTAPHGTTTR